MIAWTRVHAIVALREEIGRSPRVHVTCKVRPCGNIVPHGRNKEEGCGSIGEKIPLLTILISPLYSATRGAPHGRPRGLVASLPLGAPPAWATRVLPRGLSATSLRRGGPARHVSPAWVYSPRQPARATSAPQVRFPFSRFF